MRQYWPRPVFILAGRQSRYGLGGARGAADGSYPDIVAVGQFSHIVTSLEGGRAKHLYQRLYCARGQAENHIKAWKNNLAADRTSCHAAEANQFRLFLHAGAYWLLWSMRRVMPKHSVWRVMQFDTLRLRLVKLAARIVELKTQIKIHLPSSAPDQAIFAMLLDRLPRLVT